ncbi:MAG: hypothetical protein GEU91_13090 [Rhizobiales bacterium]|nr:hypothetical protein [Hyphomicrobiales bacterium]
MAKVSLGVLLDQLCSEIVSRGGLELGTRLIVHPQVHRCVAESRPQEVAQGFPLMLLGLELTASEAVPPSSFKIVS